MRQILLLLLSLLILTPAAIAGSPDTDNFKLIKKNETLTLYERWIPATGGGTVRQLKAVFQVRSGVRDIIALLRNPALVSRWNAGVMSSAIYASPGGTGWLYYVSYDIPWPFNDQDCLLRYQVLELGNDAATIAFHSVESNRFPVSQSFDRITHVRGQWLVTPLGEGLLQVTYLITTDRSKQIPRWVSDPVIHRHIFQTLTEFKRLVERRS